MKIGKLNELFTTGQSKNFIKNANKIVEKINSLEESFSALSQEDLKNKTSELRARYQKGELLDDMLPEAFAMVREAAKRTMNMRHYDVQLIGGIALHKSGIAEMRTGEGKTLVATLPVFLNALTGKGVHVVTVNDYLARRDAVWMGQIYDYLGLSLSVINSRVSYIYDSTSTTDSVDGERDEEGAYKVSYEYLREVNRKDAYAADITYGTNHEFGFDYLRDNITNNKENLVQRGFYYAIVDEVDSILIDEARTPLIISMPAEESDDFYRKFADIAKMMIPETDYKVDEKQRAINLTDEGIQKAEKALGIENIYTEKGIKYVHHLETAVKAKALFIKDKDYVVNGGEIVIVDAFTGRLQPGRRWSEGLHQAVEAKEGVSVKRESRTAASITYQNYFRFYEKLSGMTGTAATSKEEFYSVYKLDVITIPTHRPIQRLDRDDLIFQTENGKFQAIARKIKELHEKGQPVLVGTISIERNELLSAHLMQEGIPHKILNAKNHEEEGLIIADAGKKGAVTIATNMAGRGIDIKLGGVDATKEQSEEVKALGGLFVLGTERHEARRIDDQLRGRAGRQGDPGETQFFVSLDDDLMRIFGPDRIKSMMGRFGIPEDMPIENSLISRGLRNAQTKIEGIHFDSRKYVLAYDDVLSRQRNAIYDRRRNLLLGDRTEIDSLLEELSNTSPDVRIMINNKKASIPEDAFYETVRRIALYVIDLLWVEHLETMDYLRSSVNLRAYGGRDPLVEYKKEALNLYKNMQISYENQVIDLIETIESKEAPKAEVIQEKTIVEEKQETKRFDSTVSEVKNVMGTSGKNDNDKFAEVGRNDPCPCGSGKKYKKCHGM
ncbi:preprotein translocase subunit SecA [Candidatus Nomurabacteria bacterium]|nr:preprotein translocase subunit SecA [Candidatus Nomurabacteria bacterium]